MPGYMGEISGMRWCPERQRYFAAGQQARAPPTEDQEAPADAPRAESARVEHLPVDPAVVAGLRRRRLRQGGGECSICAGFLGRGEMVVMLPCR
mmetsp:Transcript_6449/g.13708  ORF Transcript_6449/g.13708 Transcript_6449/m.13708 type:complete len:94 (+) Transcript_6449:42-323(+)